MSGNPQRDDQVLLAQFIRDRLEADGHFGPGLRECPAPSDRKLRQYVDDYTASYDLAKARNELEPILSVFRQMTTAGDSSSAFRRNQLAEGGVDRILAALRHMGFAP